MPGLHSANIAFKLVDQLGSVSVIGPMMLGGEFYQIVQMGASVNDIVQAAAIAAWRDAIR